MSKIDRLLLAVARWIGGPERSEWIDAMEAEADASPDAASWALGCAVAAVKDLVWRLRWRMAAVVIFPLAVFGLRLLLFFPVIRVGQALGLPASTFIAAFLALSALSGLILGRLLPRRDALATALCCGIGLEAADVVFFWISFGQGPAIWLQKGSHIYNMAPVLGWSVGIAVWLIGAWFGSMGSRPAAKEASTNG